MECVRQAYWWSEYTEYQCYFADTPAHREYKSFCKQQFHKARRQHDKEIIDNQLQEICENTYCEYNPFRYI